jgi:alanine racemase
VHDRPTTATIRLDAIRANFDVAKRRAAGRAVIAVVKADAYGHGAVPAARALLQAGCARFAVATLDEAVALRQAGVDLPILLMGGVHGAAGAEAVVAHRLTPVVHHRGHVGLLAQAARGEPLPVQVEVDTGMRRMGVAPEQAVAVLEAVRDEASLVLEGVYTHFARADEPELAPTLEQIAGFGRVLRAARARGVEPGEVHVAQSAGLLAGKVLADALPEVAAVRPGLMLYGVRPAPHIEGELQPAMTLATRVVQLRELRRGDAVGYAALFRARRATRVATLPLGYADGMPVAASNRAQVLIIRGRRLPVVGRVSMDFVGVDVGDTPVGIGDEAIIFGEGQGDRISVEEAAEAAGTISYELLARVGSRVPRLYEP